MVDAGAVVAARAESTIEKVKLSSSTQYVRINIAAEAKHASNNVIKMTFGPFFFSEEKRKNWPVLNEMNAKAMSDRKSIPSITVSGIKSRQNGPISIPVII
jgi:hypothetical protein